MNKEEKLLKIINHHGINTQQRKLAEETFELQEIITKYEDYYYENYDYGIGKVDWARWREHIAEEIADVCVLLLQFKEYYHIDGNDILRIINEKIDRTLERMEE